MFAKYSPRYPVLILVLFVLSGCAVKFIYNQLDWLIPWYLDDYVTLDAKQESQFEAELEAYLSWHRRQQLPVYAEFLEWVALSSQDGLDCTEIDQIFDRSETFTNQLFTRLGPSLVSIFESLSDQQIQEMFANFTRENEKFRAKYILKNPIKQRYSRAKDVKNFIQRWTGQLDEEQQDLIRQWSQHYELMGKEFLQSRQGWQDRLKATLKQRNNHEQFETSLMALFANRTIGRSTEYEQKLKRNRQRLKSLYLKIDKSLTGTQRQRLIKELNNYAKDFRDLALQNDIH